MKKKILFTAAILVALALCAYLLLKPWDGFGAEAPLPVPTTTPTQLETVTPTETTVPTTPMQTPAPTTKVETGMLGTLEVLGSKINIAPNVDEKTLEKQPGHLPSSVLPGEDGMSVIMGHRNRTHFRVLENVKVGDEIRFTYADGRSVVYTVSEIRFYEDSNYTLPITEGKTLVLVTCYPFRYSGNAPGKCLLLSQMQ